MNKKHKRILKSIFKIPVQSSVKWKDVESMLIYMGAEITEGAGSRVKVELCGMSAVFHRPHPRKEIDKGALVSIRRFLEHAGIDHAQI